MIGADPFGGPIRTKYWDEPERWNRRAAKQNLIERVFTCSMSDFFHPGADDWRGEAWDIMRRCTHLDWLILTKRPEFIFDRLPWGWGNGWRNVWIGVSCGTQDTINRMVPKLRQIPCQCRFLSCEPLLENLDLKGRFITDVVGGIAWVIVGGESGSGHREMPLAAAAGVAEQCDAAGVPVFVKQDSGQKPGQRGRLPDQLWARKEFPYVWTE